MALEVKLKGKKKQRVKGVGVFPEYTLINQGHFLFVHKKRGR